MNEDLISRSALKEEFAKHEDRKGYLIGDWEDFIDNAPPVPLPEFKEGYKQAIIDGKTNFYRSQGEWINEHWIDIGYKTAVCSCCGERSRLIAHDTGFGNEYEGYPFCPWCGADMRKEAERCHE